MFTWLFLFVVWMKMDVENKWENSGEGKSGEQRRTEIHLYVCVSIA